MNTAASGAVAPTRRLTAASVGGAIVAAFAASLCCLGPLIFAALGLGGAGLLVKFEAYRPYFAALTLVLSAQASTSPTGAPGRCPRPPPQARPAAASCPGRIASAG